MRSTGSYQDAKQRIALGPIIASPITAVIALGDVASDLTKLINYKFKKKKRPSETRLKSHTQRRKGLQNTDRPRNPPTKEQRHQTTPFPVKGRRIVGGWGVLIWLVDWEKR
ncbi:hypothetical protein ACB098_06G089900 [Castanea mollissima]